MRLILLMTAALVMTACNQRDKDLAFDGQYYRTSTKKVGDDRALFQSEIKPVSQSLLGAREAGRHEATKYCIENFGTSNVVWTRGPDAVDGAVLVSNDTLVLQGTCSVL